VTQDEPVDILVVEDDDSQRESIVLGLQNAIAEVLVVAVQDGAEALDYLFARGAWAGCLGNDPPRLILLDLAMPGTDGFSVLGQIRALDTRNVLALTPVVIFTDSQATGDISRSYRCGANSYILKPLSYPVFQATVETVGKYWLNLNKAPA